MANAAAAKAVEQGGWVTGYPKKLSYRPLCSLRIAWGRNRHSET